MPNFEDISCRLCLKTVTDTSFKEIDDVTRDVLCTLLLQLKCNGESKQVLCNACNEKLNAALKFKTICLNTNNTIIQYVNWEEMVQLDLKEIYMKEKVDEESTDISCDKKVCRLCMLPIKNEFRCIQTEELNTIQDFIPEMNVNIIKDPIICNLCFDSLCIHNKFIKDCLDVGNERTTSPLNFFIKTENFDEESKMNECEEMEMSIKTESIEIKSEKNEAGSDSFTLKTKEETVENSNHQYENRSQMYKCDIETKHKSNSTDLDQWEKPMNVSPVEMYRCDKCAYECKSKKCFWKHQLRHGDPSKVRRYSCNTCDYKTVYKIHFTNHQLKHKNTWEVQMYTCDLCDFKTKYKNSLQSHHLKHKCLAKAPMYKCDLCEYTTDQKRYLTKHQLKHKNVSEVRMYDCNICDFKTRYKSSFDSHHLKHKNPSETRLYTCNHCDFKTKYKYNLDPHLLKHKNLSEVSMHACSKCDYETRNKKCLRAHLLRHKAASELTSVKSANLELNLSVT